MEDTFIALSVHHMFINQVNPSVLKLRLIEKSHINHSLWPEQRATFRLPVARLLVEWQLQRQKRGQGL